MSDKVQLDTRHAGALLAYLQTQNLTPDEQELTDQLREAIENRSDPQQEYWENYWYPSPEQ